MGIGISSTGGGYTKKAADARFATKDSVVPLTTYLGTAGLNPVEIYESVVVSGAGTTSSNGTYIRSGFSGGKPVYNSGLNTLSWSIGDAQWYIFDDEFVGDVTYVSNSDTSYPWEATGWSAVNAANPAPTLTPGSLTIAVNILPTVTNYLSTNNVFVSALRVTDGLTVVGNVSATNTFYASAIDIRPSSVVIGLTAIGRTPTCLKFKEQYLYVLCEDDNTLNVYDTSTNLPQFVASATTLPLRTGNGGSYQNASFDIQGNFAYVATVSGVQSFNISGLVPVSASYIPTTSFNTSFYTVPSAPIVVKGRYAYILYGNGTPFNSLTLQCIDISDPYEMVNTPGWSPDLYGTYTGSPALVNHGSYLYIATAGIAGSYIIRDNLANNPALPERTILSSSLGLSNSYGGSIVQGRYFYLNCSSGSNIQVIDLTTVTSVTSLNIGSISTGGQRDVVVQGNTVYVLRDGGIVVLDVSNPRTPQLINTIPLSLGIGRYCSFVVRGRFGYLSTGSNNNIYKIDLGGAYIQQLRTGNIQTENVYVDKTLYAGSDINAVGAGAFGTGLNVQGAANVQGNLTISPKAGTQTVFNNFFSVLPSNTSPTDMVFTITNTDRVGVYTSNPNERLTVVGGISATEVVYALSGNSNQWRSTYTTVQSNSANWQPSESFEIESDGEFYSTSFISVRPIRPEIYLLPFTRYGTYSFTNLISSQFTSFEGTITLNSEIKNPTKYFNFKNLEYFNGSITINSFASLTGLTFPDLKACTQGITIASNNALSSINLNELVYVGSNLAIGGYGIGAINENLQTINFPKLVFIGGSFFAESYRGTAGHNSPLREINLPALEVVGSANNFVFGSTVNGNTTYPLITSISLSSLKMVGDFTLRRCANLVSLNLPSLIRMSSLQLNESTNLRDIDLPELKVIGGYIFNTVPNLTSASMPKLEILTNSTNVTLNMTTLSALVFGTDTLRQALASYTFNTTLNQTSVDDLLKAYARLDGTGLTESYGTSRTLSIAGSNKAPTYTGGVTTTSAGTNFVRTGTTVVASVVGHGHTTGDIVTFTGNTQSNLNGTYTVTVNTLNQFQYTTTGSGNLTGGGTVTMRRTTVATDGFRYFQTIALRGATVTINFP